MAIEERSEQPWERRPGEGSRAFAAFQTYRDLGHRRSLNEVARRLSGWQGGGKRAAGRLQAWSRRWGWVERVQAWDAYLDAESRGAQVEAVRELQRKHQLFLRNMFNNLIVASQKVDWDHLTPAQCVNLTAQLIHLERLVHGEPVSVERVHHAGDRGGPVAHVVAAATFDPTPEVIARALAILADVGAFDGDASEGAAPGEPGSDRGDRRDSVE